MSRPFNWDRARALATRLDISLSEACARIARSRRKPKPKPKPQPPTSQRLYWWQRADM
jgi:hypothetical protein